MKPIFLSILGIALILPFALQSQNVAGVSSAFPSPTQPTVVYQYSGTNRVATCYTKSTGPWGNAGTVPASFSWTRTATTLTSIADATNTSTITTSTAHGLRPGNAIVITGATVDVDLNGTYVIQTVGAATTFTITTASVTDATYNEDTLSVTTSAPRSTVAIWAVMRSLYDGSNNKTADMWANGAPTYVNICDNYATLTYR